MEVNVTYFEASGKEFQDYVQKSLKRKYPPKDGWEVIPQKQVRTRGILCKADFLIENSRRKKRIVVEAKDKSSLSTSDLRQLKEYKRQTKADEAIFYIANNTNVSRGIEEAVEKSTGMSIERTRYKRSSRW